MRPDGHLGEDTMNLTVIADFEDNGAPKAQRAPPVRRTVSGESCGAAPCSTCALSCAYPPPTPDVHHWTCDTVCIVSLCVPVVL